LEKRTTVSIGAPWKGWARLSAAAAGVAVKVARAQLPLACSARRLGCEPKLALAAAIRRS